MSLIRTIIRWAFALVIGGAVLGFAGANILLRTHLLIYIAVIAVIVLAIRGIHRQSRANPQVHPQILQNPVAHQAYFGTPAPQWVQDSPVTATLDTHTQLINRYGADHPAVHAHAAALVAQGLLPVGTPAGFASPLQQPEIQAVPVPAPVTHDAPAPLITPADNNTEIPGTLGAAAALVDHPAIDHITIVFDGAVQGWVSAHNWRHTPEFELRDPSDPTYQAVAWMVCYAQEILQGFLPGPYREQDAIVYAALKLIPHELLERPIFDIDGTAETFRIPAALLQPELTDTLRRELARQSQGGTGAAISLQ